MLKALFSKLLAFYETIKHKEENLAPIFKSMDHLLQLLKGLEATMETLLKYAVKYPGKLQTPLHTLNSHLKVFEARIHYNSGIYKNQIRFYRTSIIKPE
mmetsp:Transcript_29561/g.26982  ORF Transcript_29561/g.26982 Transcript_29561/m.26982 type:complete len:99 (+) Transcript_29561:1624-1920(+)